MSLQELSLLQLKDMRCNDGKDETAAVSAPVAVSLFTLEDAGRGHGMMLLIGLPSSMSSSSLGSLAK